MSHQSSIYKITIVLTNGQNLKIFNPIIVGEKIVGDLGDGTSKEVEFSDIKTVKIEKYDYTIPILYAGAAVIVAFLLIGAATAPSPPPVTSCPFIYSYDGENYILDAEPYGGAYARGLQRTDWCALENLKEVGGKYSILVSNELEETQYTDELKLITVDHPKGIKVAPDPSGKIHTLRNLVAPVSAYDKKGRDLLPLVAEIDRVMWLSQEEERNEDSLREELIFEFPKPIEAQKAKLVVNAQTTLWGSEVAKRYIELYGDDVNKYFQDINSHGPAYSSNIMMNLREELYGLQIRVETDKGWETKEIIRGGNPLISENVVYNLDLGDVTGETLKIKLTPPAAFWMINFLAADYTEDLPVTLTALEAEEAVDHKGQDVHELLATEDSKYHEMPDISDSVNVVFESTPRIPGMERTVFLKANGYYDIHLQAEGAPQYELIQRLQREPGFALQHAHQEYLQWKKELAQKDKLQ